MDTYINLEKTYDYYKDKFNRNSIDNKGTKVEAFVDYNAVGDAAWSEEFNSMFLEMVMEKTLLICQSL